MAVRKSASIASKSAPARSKTPAQESRYIYHANAVAVGGRITRYDPDKSCNVYIPALGATCLSGEGGESESAVEEYTLPQNEDDLIYVGSAKSWAWSMTPDEIPNASGSCAEVEVSKLGIIRQQGNDKFKIWVEGFSASLSSSCKKGELYPGVEVQCSLPEVVLDGVSIRVDLDTSRLNKYPNYKALQQQLLKNPKFRREIAWQRGWPPYKGGMCTVVRKLEFDKLPPDMCYEPPNCIYWKGVGRIFAGELLVTASARSLTVLRVKLGCPIEGDVGCGEVETDGHFMP